MRTEKMLDQLLEVYRSVWQKPSPLKDQILSVMREIGVINDEKTIDTRGSYVTIRSEENSDDFPNHKGRPGEVGGSLPEPSAKGPNPRCVGFEHKKTAAWKLRKHGVGYEGMTVDEFSEKACDLLEKPCKGNIDGYLQKDGSIVRYDRTTGDFAIGFPGGYLKTMYNIGYNQRGKFSIDRANGNFEKYRERDEVKDNGDDEK